MFSSSWLFHLGLVEKSAIFLVESDGMVIMGCTA